MIQRRFTCRRNPTPKLLAIQLGLLGAFGGIAYGSVAVAGSEHVPVATVGYFLLASGLMVAAAAKLWAPSPLGWWLAWSSMLVIAGSGLLPYGSANPATTDVAQLSTRFRAAFMLVAAGWFFAGLSHPAVYRACFARSAPPGGGVLGALLILILAGTAILVVEPFGIVVGVSVLLLILISGSARWMAVPLIALLSPRSGGNAG